jgi:glycosyltransferase involved in cell wall biosynthesis
MFEEIKLSILIPSIPSRFKRFERLFERINDQASKSDIVVEVLGLFDNKKRSIGHKRDALVQMSKGDYVCFCDDDDDVSDDYVESLLEGIKHNPDVVCFKQKAIINGDECIVDFDLKNENNEFKKDRTVKRKPFHVCAFKGEIARKHRFNDSNYGEDWQWCEMVLEDVKTQYKIDKIIHTYVFDSEVTEAL